MVAERRFSRQCRVEVVADLLFSMGWVMFYSARVLRVGSSPKQMFLRVRSGKATDDRGYDYPFHGPSHAISFPGRDVRGR